MSWDFELIAGPYGGTTEGPVWNGEAVLFTHIPASRILRYDPKTGETSEYFTGTNRTNGLCFDAQGNLYGCQSGGRRIVMFGKDGTTISSLPHEFDGKAHTNPNDLAVDKPGRLGCWESPALAIGLQLLEEPSSCPALRLDAVLPVPNGLGVAQRGTCGFGASGTERLKHGNQIHSRPLQKPEGDAQELGPILIMAVTVASFVGFDEPLPPMLLGCCLALGFR